MKAEAEGIFLWAFEGLQRLVANNFKFFGDRIRENREAVKRDNNNIFDFMESEGYIRLQKRMRPSTQVFCINLRMWCEENSAPLKTRSFDASCNARKFNLEHCNNIITLPDGRYEDLWAWKLWQDLLINRFDVSPCTYVRRTIKLVASHALYVSCQHLPVFFRYRKQQLSSDLFSGIKNRLVNGNSKVLTAGRNYFTKIVLL